MIILVKVKNPKNESSDKGWSYRGEGYKFVLTF